MACLHPKFSHESVYKISTFSTLSVKQRFFQINIYLRHLRMRPQLEGNCCAKWPLTHPWLKEGEAGALEPISAPWLPSSSSSTSCSEAADPGRRASSGPVTSTAGLLLALRLLAPEQRSSVCNPTRQNLDQDMENYDFMRRALS